MPDRTTLRALRVTAFSAVCLVLGVLGHGWESGRQPAAAPVALGAGVVVFAGSRLATRERSLAALAAAVLGLQAVLHVVLALSTGAAGAAGAHAGHLGAGTGAAQSAGQQVGMSAGMLAVHVLAGLAAAWWLRRGEAAAWACCRWLAVRAARTAQATRTLRLLLAAAAAATAPADRRRPTPYAAVSWSPTPRTLRHVLSRRGPPAVPAS